MLAMVWFLLRKHILTVPRFDLFLQGALLIVVFLESYVFLLLRRNAGTGYLRTINEGLIKYSTTTIHIPLSSHYRLAM